MSDDDLPEEHITRAGTVSGALLQQALRSDGEDEDGDTEDE